MKIHALILALLVLPFVGFSQVSPKSTPAPDPNKKLMIVEASCGECQFGLQGEDCNLAVNIDGKSYFVDGPTIHDYGHPHNKNGFCVAIRKAEVQGEIVDGRFKASYFKLLDVDSGKTEKEKK